MNHKDLFKSKITIRESQADRRQNFKNKRAMERDNIRNFGRDITMTLENSPIIVGEPNKESNHFKKQFKMKYREIITNKKDKEAALSYWRPPFVSVVPVGKYIDPPTTSALAKRITKTQENIQKTLTAKKIFPLKTPDEARRSKRNIKPLNLNSESKNNQFHNYVRKIGRENAGFTFVHSTTTKNKKKPDKARRKSIVVINNFQVSDEDDLAGISPIEDANDEAQTPTISILQNPQQIVSNIEEEVLSAMSRSPQLGPRDESITSLPNNYISPFVTTSRGKSKRETIKHISIDSLNISNDLEGDDTEEMKKNREAALKYENFLNDEIKRLEELNQKWELYRSENMHLADCLEMIDGTVGQTKLLMSSKFLQFRKVIDNCRFQNGDRPIFPLDLEGFWEVVKLQIKNVDDRFIKLENLRANDWNDDIITAKVINKKRPIKKGKTKSKSAISSLKGLIENKRKQLMDGNAKEVQASTSGRKTRQSFRAIVLSATAIKHTPQLKSLRSPDIIHGDKIEINHELENLNLSSPVIKFPKKREKSIRFVEPRKSCDSDVILLENTTEEDKENELIEQVTPTNSTKRTSKKYRDTPKIPILNLINTPQSNERRRSVRTPKSKLSFCDELQNCSIRDSPIRINKRTPKRTRKITALINE